MPLDYYTIVKNRLQEVFGLSNFNVTRRAITYGSRDSWNGHRAVTWATSTVEVMVIPKDIMGMATVAGVYPKLDIVGITKDTFANGDQILDSNSKVYSVEEIEPLYYPGSTTLIYQKLHGSYLQVYESDFGSTTWTLTRETDARYRTKAFIEAYVRTGGNNRITKDDDSTVATWACIFANPPYSMTAEFRAASNPVQGLYVVNYPNSTPEVSFDKTIVAYDEHVPIHILTCDSTGCSAEALMHKMRAELRYICKTYASEVPNLRLMERETPRAVNLGGMQLLDNEWLMIYTREASEVTGA